MVAVVSGNGLGLGTSSLSSLGSDGAVGGAAEGKASEQVYVNSTTGNLVIQDSEDYLAALGLDLPITRTYNSQGQLTDDFGGEWRLGVDERLINLTGTVNTASSTIVKVFGDESQVTFTYDATQGKYFGTGKAGARDELTFNATTQQWTWTDGFKLGQFHLRTSWQRVSSLELHDAFRCHEPNLHHCQRRRRPDADYRSVGTSDDPRARHAGAPQR